ncbi:S41 family peptidase [Algoriphagus pacificus]|uniref:Carboxyl-terminal protease n=1 Tax=Algoriphagus pacificus TaxID=2811234 RepID=A0ABS3CJG5_9BACT|nr:S41 family peptidase [Algoriphagus pacificus]MBN7817237.1 carboxyl-terminal protease [Algoriphagus pacificus]
MKKHYLYLSLLLVGIWSCNKKDDPTPNPQSNAVRDAIYSGMEEWYYWNKELPAKPNTSDFASNEEFLEAIKFKPLDRFSYLTTQEDFNNAFVGRNAGHGFGFAFDANERLFLTFVFDESPAGKDGWQRGWEILEVNGKPISEYKTSTGGYDFKLGGPDPGITNSFKFKLPDGTETTRSNTKAEYQSNSVLYQSVIDLSGKKVGYWVYNSFKATQGLSPTQSKEVENSMAYFESENITDLIIDLRYNGGGSVDVAEQILNSLIQLSNDYKVMYTNKLNSLKSDFNKTENFVKKGNLNLNKLVFITSRGSASASELVINCLDPYFDITLVGDNTYGKPVGSFPLSSYEPVLKENNVELVPITFSLSNANGKADYFDGFPADFLVGDTPQFNWGSENDLRLAAAIQVLENGNVNSRLVNTFYRPKWEMIDQFKGLQQEFPAY